MQRSRLPLYLIVIALLATALMWPGLTGGFLLDDIPNIVANADVQASQWSLESLRRAIGGYHGPIGRPLATVSFAANHVLTGLDPWWFKATNLGMHVFNALLVALLARSLLTLAWKSSSNSQKDLIAAVIALVWAVHPLQVSTTLYVVQRMEILATSCVLLALLAYLKGRQLQTSGQPWGWHWLIASGVLTIFGLLSKESAALIPLYTLAIEWTLLRFRATSQRSERWLRILYVLGAVLGLLALALASIQTMDGYAGREFTMYERLLSQLRILVMYLYWSVWPAPSNLTFHHDDFIRSQGLVAPWTTLASGAFLFALVGYAVWIRKQRPLSALGIALFFSAHLLTSSPIPLELIFEHRNYFALLGVILLLADTFIRSPALPLRMPIAAGLTAAFLGLAFTTALRSATWGNPLSLAISMSQDNPTSPRAAFDLAVAYLKHIDYNPNSPLYPKAIAALEHAGAIPRSSPLPEQALILLAYAHGSDIKDRWWTSMQRKIDTNALTSQEFTAIYALHASKIKGSFLPTDRLRPLYEGFLRRYPENFEMNLVYADFARIVLRDEQLSSRHRRIAASIQK